MIVGFITTYVISTYHQPHYVFESGSGEMYLIQHYMKKFVSGLRQVGGFFPGTPVPSTNKTDRHEITKILLTVALNTITIAYFRSGAAIIVELSE